MLTTVWLLNRSELDKLSWGGVTKPFPSFGRFPPVFRIISSVYPLNVSSIFDRFPAVNGTCMCLVALRLHMGHMSFGYELYTHPHNHTTSNNAELVVSRIPLYHVSNLRDVWVPFDKFNLNPSMVKWLQPLYSVGWNKSPTPLQRCGNG